MAIIPAAPRNRRSRTSFSLLWGAVYKLHHRRLQKPHLQPGQPGVLVLLIVRNSFFTQRRRGAEGHLSRARIRRGPGVSCSSTSIRLSPVDLCCLVVNKNNITSITVLLMI